MVLSNSCIYSVRPSTVQLYIQCQAKYCGCCVFVGDGVPLSPMTSLDIPPNFDPNSSNIDEILLEADGRMLMESPPLDLTWDLLCDSNTFKVSAT